MTDKSSEAARPGRLTQTAAPAAVLTPIISGDERSVKLATMRETEQFLSQLWDEPAAIVMGYIGGHGPAPYARSETYFVPLEHNASGFTILFHEQETDG